MYSLYSQQIQCCSEAGSSCLAQPQAKHFLTSVWAIHVYNLPSNKVAITNTERYTCSSTSSSSSTQPCLLCFVDQPVQDLIRVEELLGDGACCPALRIIIIAE